MIRGLLAVGEADGARPCVLACAPSDAGVCVCERERGVTREVSVLMFEINIILLCTLLCVCVS